MSTVSKSDFSSGLAHKVCCAWAGAEGTPAELNSFVEDDAAIRLVLAVRRGKAKIVPSEVEQEPEVSIDPIIRVNRTATYSDWVKKLMHPDLQDTSPTEYVIDRVQQWLHPDQGSGKTTGNTIYGHLKDADTLKDQLGLVDLLAIRVKGIAFFRKYFAGKAVFGWKSVVQSHSGGLLYVPCLIGVGDRVVLDWSWLDSRFNSRSPGLRFASPPANG